MSKSWTNGPNGPKGLGKDKGKSSSGKSGKNWTNGPNGPKGLGKVKHG